MKKIIYLFLTLFTVASYGQADFPEGVQISGGQPTVTNDPYVTTTGATGIQGKIAPVNVIIPHTPVNYTVPNLTIGAHLSGIDTRLGQISSTTAGLTQRIYFTADNTTVNSIVYFASNATSKGSTAAGSPPNLVLADNTKGYFTKDLISIPQPAPTIGYAGSYSGNLTVSATPTPIATQQRFTVEVYRTDNLGVPIASGVSGAPVGDLGVTVVAILDSGIINLTAGSITNVSITGILTQNITINTGERLRYHVSAAKIGAGGGNVTFGVYYGSSYNSYYDVPVAITTDAVLNKSTVTGVTDTDALNNLKAAIPVNYSKVVYVNATNPNGATIFDLNNPPTVNDNALKADVNNLYVGSDSSGWVYNSTSLTYTSNTITSTLSNFYLSGTTTDAGGNKTGQVYRTGKTGFGVTSSTSLLSTIHAFGIQNSRIIHAESDLTPTVGVTMVQGIGFSQINLATAQKGYAVNGYNVNPDSATGIVSQVASSADTGTLPVSIIQANKWDNAGGGIGGQVTTRPVFGVYNFATPYFQIAANANTIIGTTTSQTWLNSSASFGTSKLNMSSSGGARLIEINREDSVITGGITGGAGMSMSTVPFANSAGGVFGNNILGYSRNPLESMGLRTATVPLSDTGTEPIIKLEAYGSGTNSFSGITLVTNRPILGIYNYSTSLFRINANGSLEVNSTPTTSAGTYDIITRNTSTGVFEKVASTLYATTSSPTFTGDPKAPTPTAGDNDTSIATTAFVSNAVSSGTYTPTLTNVTNVTGLALQKASYTKIGNVITVNTSFSFNITSASVNSQFTITLPINRTSASSFNMGSGSVVSSNTPNNLYPCVLTSGSTSNVTVYFVPTATASSYSGSVSFQYLTTD